MPPGRRVAIVHDYLTQRGGAERVVLAMARAFPGAPIYTSLYEPAGTFREFQHHQVITSSLQRWSALRRHHRLGLLLYAPTFSRMAVEAEVTICSTSGWAHGVSASGSKVLYVHNVARWLYQPDTYLGSWSAPARVLARAAGAPLRRWDRRSAQGADAVLVNSRTVHDRVADRWGLESEVLHPPYGVDPGGPRQQVPGLEPGFLLAVARLLSYKRVDAVVEAARLLPQHVFVVAGDGPEGASLKRGAPSNCVFLGEVEDPGLRWLYANCRCLVSAATDDLGLTPLEAASFGKPVAVLRSGGYLETVIEGVTGIFFERAAGEEVAKAVRELEGACWDEEAIRLHAARFSEPAFVQRLREVVDRLA